MSGFIRLERDAFEHPLLRDDKRFRAWFWMVAKACWKPHKFDISGKTIELQRGQFVASRNQLAKEWGWSPSAVVRFLTRLETEQMIGQATGQGRTIITIRNYNKYNPIESETGQDTGQATGQAADKQRTAKEQGNNINLLKRAIPKDWEPEEFSHESESGRIVASWSPQEHRRHLEQFTAHHTAANSKFSNWQSAWSKWVINSEKFKPRNGNGTGFNKPSGRNAAELARANLGIG